AEDGIRDDLVTGVQTCALPIFSIDVLAFGPHPDDAEIGCGGLLLKMKSLGYTTGIIDMTRGDMGWGTPEERDRECDEAAKILQQIGRASCRERGGVARGCEAVG